MSRKPAHVNRVTVPTQKQYPFVQVVWWDAADSSKTWGTEAEAIEFGSRPCEIVSYGYLLSKTRSYVVLAADRILQDEPNAQVTFGRITKIPTPWIRKTRALTVRIG